MHLLFQVLEWIVKALVKDANTIEGQWRPVTAKRQAVESPREAPQARVPRGRKVIWTREGSRLAKLRRYSRSSGPPRDR
jgi:hypothetical protein